MNSKPHCDLLPGAEQHPWEQICKLLPLSTDYIMNCATRIIRQSKWPRTANEPRDIKIKLIMKTFMCSFFQTRARLCRGTEMLLRCKNTDCKSAVKSMLQMSIKIRLISDVSVNIFSPKTGICQVRKKKQYSVYRNNINFCMDYDYKLIQSSKWVKWKRESMLVGDLKSTAQSICSD